MSKTQKIKTRQDGHKSALLDQLRRLPIREIAYEKVGISRMTCTRWRNASKKFADEMDAAAAEGREFINGLAESQVINLIRQGKLEAARLWLQHNSSRYAHKLELSVTTNDEPMSKTEKALSKQALKHSSLTLYDPEKTQKQEGK